MGATISDSSSHIRGPVTRTKEDFAAISQLDQLAVGPTCPWASQHCQIYRTAELSGVNGERFY